MAEGLPPFCGPCYNGEYMQINFEAAIQPAGNTFFSDQKKYNRNRPRFLRQKVQYFIEPFWVNMYRRVFHRILNWPMIEDSWKPTGFNRGINEGEMTK